MIAIQSDSYDSDEDDYEDEYDEDDDMRMVLLAMLKMGMNMRMSIIRIMMMKMMMMKVTMLKNLLSATPLWSASSVESNCFPRSSTSSRLKSLEPDIIVCDPLLMLVWAGQSGVRVFRTTYANLDSPSFSILFIRGARKPT